ncbi:hypothetical protein CDV36_016230 [Fusarium kuroshium]|uniref:Uncharacterized protein n=2 Tax=Fusarium solani species complex TaxID=232080 RepID=A0A3M2QWW9_9HYPO|nr:hypothetical protein CDV36_016230 [Fusarium kuroshium]RSL77535.1 hypothetical protein CDV31_017320 [Fusarium ambrosium]
MTAQPASVEGYQCLAMTSKHRHVTQYCDRPCLCHPTNARREGRFYRRGRSRSFSWSCRPRPVYNPQTNIA